MEAFAQSVVFVNGVRSNFKVLHDGYKLTLGGAKKSFDEGSRLPLNPGPHLTYEYKITRETNPVGVYQEPTFRPGELVVLEDFVNGKICKETYNMEDFNQTMVAFQCFNLSVYFHVMPISDG